jgi:trimethylamine---corrinoid protein Co-methyltransferase
MTKNIKSITDPQISLNILSKDDIQKIHAATLEVIESIGVRFPSQKALDILASHGAKIDQDKMVARIPAPVIEKALEGAPPGYTLAAMDPALDLPLDGNHSYLATDGCGVEILDPFTGELRRSTKQDVADIARVADFMEEISFHWVPLSAQDCPPESRSLHELDAIWTVSGKHVQTETIVTEPEMYAAIEMASILVGGREELRKRPVLSITQCTTSPLSQDGGSLEAGLVAAQAGLPVGFMTMASAASTAPATLAGTLVVGNAEVLAALALMQLAYPGCPVYYAAAQTATDLRTGAYTGGGPADFLFGAATNLLADYYNIPLSMGAFATGAKEPDWQAALDNSLSAFMAVSTLADMLLGAGLLHGSRIFSFEQLLLDCEIWSLLHAMFQGIPVDQDSLALDAIQQVGPGGNYLSSRHTLKNMHALWQPKLLDRRPYSAWEVKRDGARQWAGEKARQVLKDHQPDRLDEQIKMEFKRIMDGLDPKLRFDYGSR